MAAEKKIIKPQKYMTVQFRIFIVFILPAIFIIVSGLGAAALYLTEKINDSSETMINDILIRIILIEMITIVLSVIGAAAAVGIAVHLLKRPFLEAKNFRRETKIAPISDSVFHANNVNKIEERKKNPALPEIEKPVFNAEVLLCEDNEMNQKIISEHLARVNLKTVIAENGRIGVEMVQRRKINGEKQFDLIFMDMQMPVMDGLEASAQIVKLNTGIPIIAMTANVSAKDTEIYRKAGMNDCIGKPFKSQELMSCLLKYLIPVSAQDYDKDASFENNPEFLKNIRKMFIKNNREKYKEITEALNRNDIEQAYRLVHTVKSNAGHIGKKLLQQAAGNVEFQLKDGKNQVSAGMIGILEKEMNDVLSEFFALVDDSEAQESAKIPFLEPEKALELLNKLKPMVEMCNPECLKFTDDLRRVDSGDLLINQMINQLIKQLKDYDFEIALLTLEELMKKW